MMVSMSKILLLNKDMAFDYVIRFLRSKYDTWFNPLPVNKGRHRLLQPQVKEDVPVFYCLFKREFLREFNLFAQNFLAKPDYEIYRGVGESINREWLDYAVKIADYLLFIYPDKKMYIISPVAVKKFCEKHSLIRTQAKPNEYKLPDFSESKEILHEKTYFFPVKLLERFEEEWEG